MDRVTIKDSDCNELYLQQINNSLSERSVWLDLRLFRPVWFGRCGIFPIGKSERSVQPGQLIQGEGMSLIFKTPIQRVAAFFVLTLSLFVFAPFVAPLQAQSDGKGTIQGTVTDPSGAIIPGALITVTEIATAETHSQKSTGAGFYSIGSLNPGAYTVSVTAQGFEKYVQQNVTLDALQVLGLNATLKVGGGDETVTISTAPPTLDTSNGTLGATIENETYEALPLNMGGAPRDPTAFVFLSPGVAGASSPYGSFNGGQGYHNEVYIEGIATTNSAAAGGGNTASVVRGASVDAVDQFQVQTSGTSAAFQGQGVENYTLKSGTNTYHGRAFEYFRNTVLDTWGFFSKAQVNPVTGLPVKPVERQNEYGGTFGGPVIIPHVFNGKDKLFFFVSYDAQRYLKGANPSFVSVPTLAQRNGDFSATGNQTIYDPATTVCNASGSSCTRQQFVSDASNTGIPVGTKNVIPIDRMSPQMLYYQNYIPLPTNSNLTNNYLAGFNTGFTYYKFSAKVDYNITKKDRLTFLFLTGNRAALPACCDSSGLPPPFTATVGNFQTYPTGIIEETHTINDHWINQFKYAVIRSSGYSTNPAEGLPAYAATAAGITNILPGQASMAAPRIGLSGNNAPASLGGTANSNNQANSEYGDSFVLYDTMQLVKGRHSMNFGGQYAWEEDNDTTLTTGTYLNLNYAPAETANFSANSITPITTTGLGYASYLIGNVDNYSEVDNRLALTTGARFYSFSPFFQDDIKLRPNLTINAGLRWDLYSSFREVQNRLSFLDPKSINPVTGTPGILTFAGSGAGTCNCTRASQIPYKNFSPHVGFAYSVTPRTVIRSSFDLAFTHDGGVGGRGGARQGASQLGFSSNNTSVSPNGYAPALTLNNGNSALATVAPPTRTNTFGTGYTTTPGFTAAGQGIAFVDQYLAKRAPYYMNFNFGVQQSLTAFTTFSLDYSGSNGRFLPTGAGNYANSGQLDPKYFVLGSLLSAPANAANIVKAQAILPSYQLPFPNFNPTNTIGQSLRPFPQYNGLTDVYGDFGRSSYNSLIAVLAEKPHHGLSFTFNYTWSKLFDNTGTGRTAYRNESPVTERSVSLYNHPQNISSYFVYAEPFGKGNHFTDHIIRNFEVSGIYTFTSGTPLAVTSTGCVTYLSGTCEPNLNPNFSGSARINGTYGHGHTVAQLASTPFLASAAFSTPAAYTFGNAPRTAPYGLYGPGGYNLNMSLRRSFGIFERLKLVMQLDAFNVTNHTNFSNPAVGVSSGTYGTISGAANSSRDLQVDARIDF
jgi:hypothetical protein